jgi:4-carboxymuconolactone decarboxylase
MAVRRRVLGARYVDEAMRNADAFTRPLQELVTEYCWGAIWTRPGLPAKTRSLINLAMLTALNRPHEVRIHVRGALRTGCTKQEIMEVLLQTAIYCGVPAAIDSFRVARDAFAELDSGSRSGTSLGFMGDASPPASRSEARSRSPTCGPRRARRRRGLRDGRPIAAALAAAARSSSPAPDGGVVRNDSGPATASTARAEIAFDIDRLGADRS